MTSLTTVTWLVVVVVTGCSAQFPGGMYGMPGMPGMPGMGFLQDIMQNVGEMSARMSAQGGMMFEEGMRRSQSGRRFGPGSRQFRTRDGQGHTYNSPDGSFSSYSYSFGDPAGHGFEYHTGPDGTTHSRKW
ncbi:hypothetical protein ACF0H5_008968 [Mactra antiquata]